MEASYLLLLLIPSITASPRRDTTGPAPPPTHERPQPQLEDIMRNIQLIAQSIRNDDDITMKQINHNVNGQIVDSALDKNSTENHKKFRKSIEEFEKFLNVTLQDYEYISQSFIELIDEASQIMLQHRSKCNLQYDVTTLKSSFKQEKMMLDMQVKQRILDIRSKAAEVNVALMQVRHLKYSKVAICQIQKLEGSQNCSKEAEEWYGERFKEISCELIEPCKNTRKSSTGCSEDFQCGDGTCLEASSACDGKRDCTDGSDEKPGCKRHCFNGFHCGNLRCLKKSQVCDGTDDCGDGSDEAGCLTQSETAIRRRRDMFHFFDDNCVGRYHCGNGECIEMSQVCDGTYDCGNGSDEAGCLTQSETAIRGRDDEEQASPAPGESTPTPREVPGGIRVIENTVTSNCTIEFGKYLCADGTKCLELWKTCDGRPDCADGSDEDGDCGSGICGQECGAAGGVCVATPRGRVCLSHCPPGTSETPQGCLPNAPLPSTLTQLLGGLHDFLSKYHSDMRALQARTLSLLRELRTGWAQCYGSTYASLSSLKVLYSYNSTMSKG